MTGGSGTVFSRDRISGHWPSVRVWRSTARATLAGAIATSRHQRPGRVAKGRVTAGLGPEGRLAFLEAPQILGVGPLAILADGAAHAAQNRNGSGFIATLGTLSSWPSMLLSVSTWPSGSDNNIDGLSPAVCPSAKDESIGEFRRGEGPSRYRSEIDRVLEEGASASQAVGVILRSTTSRAPCHTDKSTRSSVASRSVTGRYRTLTGRRRPPATKWRRRTRSNGRSASAWHVCVRRAMQPRLPSPRGGHPRPGDNVHKCPAGDCCIVLGCWPERRHAFPVLSNAHRKGPLPPDPEKSKSPDPGRPEQSD